MYVYAGNTQERNRAKRKTKRKTQKGPIDQDTRKTDRK